MQSSSVTCSGKAARRCMHDGGEVGGNLALPPWERWPVLQLTPWRPRDMQCVSAGAGAGAGQAWLPTGWTREATHCYMPRCPQVAAVVVGLAPCYWPLHTAPRPAGGPERPSRALREQRTLPGITALGSKSVRAAAPVGGLLRVVVAQEAQAGAGAHSRGLTALVWGPGAHQHLLFLSSGRARPSPRSHRQAQRGGGLGPGVHPEEAASMKWISQTRRREGCE